MNGFKFNNKHSWTDYHVYMESKSIQPPGKKKIKLDVPFMNGSYDFSTVGSSGEITYTERLVSVVISFPTKSKQQLYAQYSKALAWLQDVNKSKLIFDDIKDYYFMAEVEDASSFEEVFRFGKLHLTFVCEPFKTNINLEGGDIWDIFNFETDVFQETAHDIVGSKTITIINTGRIISPVINVTSPMTITINSKTFNLITGNNTLYGLKLLNGSNSLYIVGTGKINFIYRVVKL